MVLLIADDGYVKTKWREERIWIEAIEKEGKAILEWNEKWGFLADYDMKGEIKEQKELPEKISVYSDSVPSSSGQTYGHRLETDVAKQMADMQKALSSTYRRQKNNALICYD